MINELGKEGKIVLYVQRAFENGINTAAIALLRETALFLLIYFLFFLSINFLHVTYVYTRIDGYKVGSCNARLMPVSLTS